MPHFSLRKKILYKHSYVLLYKLVAICCLVVLSAVSVIHRGNTFSGNTIGIAYLNTMCGSASVGVVSDRHYTTLATGSTFAHELGHIFDMGHDNSEY